MSDDPTTQRGPCGRPYRPCVGIVLLNRDGLIFAGQRIDNAIEAWQMPQGGVEPGEAPDAAAIRELGEEVGLRPDQVTVVAESARWIPYDLPDELSRRLWGGRFAGQTQKWFAMRFLGGDDAIDIATEEPEFRAWRWMAPDALMGAIVPFKRATYRSVLDEFGALIGPAR